MELGAKKKLKKNGVIWRVRLRQDVMNTREQQRRQAEVRHHIIWLRSISRSLSWCQLSPFRCSQGKRGEHQLEIITKWPPCYCPSICKTTICSGKQKQKTTSVMAAPQSASENESKYEHKTIFPRIWLVLCCSSWVTKKICAEGVLVQCSSKIPLCCSDILRHNEKLLTTLESENSTIHHNLLCKSSRNILL